MDQENFQRRRKKEEILHENGNGEISLALRDEQPINIAFIFNNVTITPPESDRILVKELTLEITRHNHLLVMGPSSSGKSSLLRVIRGLWTSKEGSVGHNLPPGPKAVIFLPQKPIMTNGSLYEQIIYPLRLDKNNPPSEETLEEILKTIDELLLHGLVERCGGLLNDPHWRWYKGDDILSPGEMQRICFLRLFYHKPQYAFLDESTSGLSLEVEEYLYSVCLKYGITLVSVGHRRSLLKFHKSLLYLFGDGTWNLESIEQDKLDNMLNKYLKE
ncbi:ATP-binding cassette sub-family D member 4 [Armadillidium vulgare]|nr:ATP-binding cassette sub-family D member 4 [Armadillidium vulgare]